MKIAFIVVLYKTPKKEVKRLKAEIEEVGSNDYKVYFVDNTRKNRGFAAAANEGIRQALIDKCDLLIIANPDISLKNLKLQDLLEAGEHFDVWGFAMKMHEKIYYGGELDPWRMSGTLVEKKPKVRFADRNWLSGSLMVIKRKVIDKVGLFAESYFMYYEDLDFCLRAKKDGFRVGVDTSVVYEHFEVSKGSFLRELYLAKNRAKFLLKYGSAKQIIYEFLRLPKTLLEYFSKIIYVDIRQVRDDKKPRSRFFVNFLSLNISSFVNKLLNFILFIFLVRYLKPEEYGVYALVWAQVSLFSPIVDLGTTSYGIIYLPTEKKEKSVSMFNLRLIISILIFFLTIFAGFIVFKRNYRIVEYIFLASFVIFSNMMSGSYLIKNALDQKLYNSSFISIIFNTALILSLSFSVIIFKSLPIIFILIFFFYNLYTFLNYLLIKKDFKKFSFKIDLNSWKGFVRKSYIFVLISFFAGLYFKIDVFLLQILKGETDVGIYSAGYKFFEAFLFIAASYNITRTPIFANLAKKNFKLLLPVVKKDLVFLALLGISSSVFIFWLSPLVLPFFLKGNYISSITVVRIVVFGLPLILISSVFLNAMYVLKKAHVIILIFLFQTFLNFLLNLFFIPRYSYVASSYITVLSEFINVALLSVTFFLILRKYDTTSP